MPDLKIYRDLIKETSHAMQRLWITRYFVKEDGTVEEIDPLEFIKGEWDKFQRVKFYPFDEFFNENGRPKKGVPEHRRSLCNI